MKAYFRTLATGLAALGATCLVVGCGSSSSATATGASSGGTPTGTIQVGSMYPAQSLDPLVQAFEHAYPKVKVKVDAASPDAYPQLVQTQLVAGTAPDVIMADGGTGFQTPLLKLAKAGRLLDLSKQPWVKSVPALVKPLVQLDGKTYGYPPDLAPSFMLYNPTLLTGAVPTTLDELKAVCGQLAAKGITPMGMAANGTAHPGALVLMMSSNLVYATQPTWNEGRQAGKTTFAGTPSWQSVLNGIQQLRDSHCFPSNAVTTQLPQMIASFAAGKIAMIPVPSAALAYVAVAKPAFTPRVFAFPGQTADATRVPASSSTNFAVNAASNNKAAAMAFLDWLSQPEGQALWEKALYSISPSDAAKGTLPSPLGPLAPFFSDHKVIVYPNALWPNPAVFNALAQGVEAIFAGRGDTATTLKQADQSWSTP